MGSSSDIEEKCFDHNCVRINLHNCIYAGWGPHAYFQMLAESRNGSQPSTVNNEIHHVQSSELQAVSVYIPPQHDADTRVNSWDSSPMLGASQNVRTH